MFFFFSPDEFDYDKFCKVKERTGDSSLLYWDTSDLHRDLKM